MLMTRVFIVCAMTFPAVLWPGADVLADGGVISSNGMAKLVKQPDLMRLKIQLVVRADGMPIALEQLADLKTAARAQLGVLGADQNSIEFTPPAVTDAKSDQQKQMEMMVMQRMRGGSKKAKDGSKTELAISTTLTAEWTLKADAPEERLVEMHEIQERIKGADLAGIADRVMTPEEEELMEEMGSIGYMGMGAQGQTEPGQPSFVVVGRITEQEHLELLTESVAKARESAARLAKAAGSQLGELKSLSATSTSIDPSDPNGNARFYMYQMMSGSGPDGAANPGEAVSLRPGAVTYHIRVTASFSLADAK